MNLALLFDEDFTSPTQVELTGRRFTHLRSVRKVMVGDQIPVGLVNGDIGTGTILHLTDSTARLAVVFNQPPPPALPLTLVLAMPRPKMFRRTLQTCASLGVKTIWLINSYKVEKSFWQTPWLSDDDLRANLTLGLEQARDTVMPEIHIRKLFKPFAEDELPELVTNKQALVAHPGTQTPCPVHVSNQTLLCVGPEGGFTPYEVGKLNDAGCQSVHLGARILRVETAVPALISRLFDACR
jgi:RsmE family RNA methyltransferase